jgi:lipase class 3 (fragment)
VTGTSGVAFKDKPSGKTIIAFTGTNLDSDSINDAVMTDGLQYCLWDGASFESFDWRFD